VIDREREVGMSGLADRLAVVEGFHHGQQVEIAFDRVGDLVEDLERSATDVLPQASFALCAASSASSMSSAVERATDTMSCP
jgi:hypothetical protein